MTNNSIFVDIVMEKNKTPEPPMDSTLFLNACTKGNISLVRSFINNGYQYTSPGFYAACKSGQIKVVELLMSSRKCDFQFGIVYALRGGYLNIIKLLMPLHITSPTWDYNNIFTRAVDNGYFDIAEWVINYVPSFQFAWQTVLDNSIRLKRYHVTVWIIKHSPKPINLSSVISMADVSDQSCLLAHLACNGIGGFTHIAPSI